MVGMVPGCCLEAAGAQRITVAPETQKGWDRVLTTIRFSFLNVPTRLRIDHIKGRACGGGLVHIALVLSFIIVSSCGTWL